MFEGVLNCAMIGSQKAGIIQNFANRLGEVDVSFYNDGGFESFTMRFDTGLGDDIKVGVQILTDETGHTTYYFMDNSQIRDIFSSRLVRDIDGFHGMSYRSILSLPPALKSFMHSADRALHIPKLFMMIEFLRSVDTSFANIVAGIEHAMNEFVRLELECDNFFRFSRDDRMVYKFPVTITGRPHMTGITFVDIELDVV